MAINKKQSALWVKATIIFVVLAFVATAVPALFMGGGQTQAPVASGAGAVMERIASTHAPAISSYTAVLESEPTSYTALVDLGNTYFDWASELRTELGQVSPGVDLPMWTAAVSSYERALAVQPGDPGVATDLAIAQFYAGQLASAIETIEAVMAESPDFAPAYFNAGIFYRTNGQEAEARAVLERHVELAPDAETAATARSWIAEIDSQGISSPETTTP